MANLLGYFWNIVGMLTTRPKNPIMNRRTFTILSGERERRMHIRSMR